MKLSDKQLQRISRKLVEQHKYGMWGRDELGEELAMDKAECINWDDYEKLSITLVREWFPDDTPSQQWEIARALDDIRGI